MSVGTRYDTHLRAPYVGINSQHKAPTRVSAPLLGVECPPRCLALSFAEPLAGSTGSLVSRGADVAKRGFSRMSKHSGAAAGAEVEGVGGKSMAELRSSDGDRTAHIYSDTSASNKRSKANGKAITSEELLHDFLRMGLVPVPGRKVKAERVRVERVRAEGNDTLVGTKRKRSCSLVEWIEVQAVVSCVHVCVCVCICTDTNILHACINARTHIFFSNSILHFFFNLRCIIGTCETRGNECSVIACKLYGRIGSF